MQKILRLAALTLVGAWLCTNTSPGMANVLYGIEGYGTNQVVCNYDYNRFEWYRTDGVSVYEDLFPVGSLPELDYSYRGANFSGVCSTWHS
jgi:hypothetical protein